MSLVIFIMILGSRDYDQVYFVGEGFEVQRGYVIYLKLQLASGKFRIRVRYLVLELVYVIIV